MLLFGRKRTSLSFLHGLNKHCFVILRSGRLGLILLTVVVLLLTRLVLAFLHRRRHLLLLSRSPCFALRIGIGPGVKRGFCVGRKYLALRLLEVPLRHR